MTTQTVQTVDPMDAAMSATYEERPRAFFGYVQTDVWFCMLVKGQGKIPFDAQVHDTQKRCTAIDIAIHPLPDSPAKFAVERGMIAESAEWVKIVMPSLKALGTDLRGVNGKWAQILQVPTGQKYVNKEGIEKERTTIKFIAVYNSEAECAAAANQFFQRRSDGTTATEPAPASAPAVSAPANGNGAEKATAQKFLPALWNASGKDPSRFAEQLAKNPLTSKYFDLNSPEVVAVVAAA